METAALPVDNLPATEKQEPWILKELKPQHKHAAALLAQGVGRQVVGEAVGLAPEYITWLRRQPLFQAYLKELSAAHDSKIKQLFGRALDVLQDKLDTPEGVTDDLAIKAVQVAGNLAGYGGQKGPLIQNNFVVQMPGRAASSAEWERAYNEKVVGPADDE